MKNYGMDQEQELRKDCYLSMVKDLYGTEEQHSGSQELPSDITLRNMGAKE